ncbi:MAG: hypothetical protein HN936_13465, partial [Bacteroidetes bacterium]|nr:hypothetical protein [Bacteroidota bacterium]
LPQPANWKQVNFSPGKKEMLENFFSKLKSMDTKGAKLARNYVLESKRIGELLVNTGVAASVDDVNKVLETGFYHAYGPINNYFN